MICDSSMLVVDIISVICGFFELVWFIAFNTESESENIINLLLASQVLMKSKARSIALASAVKIDESSGLRCRNF